MRGPDLGWRELSHIHMVRVAAAGLQGESRVLHPFHARAEVGNLCKEICDGCCDRFNRPTAVPFPSELLSPSCRGRDARRGGNLWVVPGVRVAPNRRIGGSAARARRVTAAWSIQYSIVMLLSLKCGG